MQPNTTNRPSDELPLDEDRTSLGEPLNTNQQATGFDGLTPIAQGGALFTKDSPTFGAAGLTGLGPSRRATPRWALPLLILVGVLALVYVMMHRDRAYDGATPGMGNQAAPGATPDTRSP